MLTTMKKMMRASIAFFVTPDPQVAPTSLKFTSLGEVPAARANASVTLVSIAWRSATDLEFRSAVTSICF